MSHDESAVQIDHLLADIRAVIRDALNRLRDSEQSKRIINGQRACSDLLLRGAHEFLLEFCNCVVEEQHLLREVHIARSKRAV